MVPLLLLPLLLGGKWTKAGGWRATGGGVPEPQLSLGFPAGSLQEDPGYKLQVLDTVTVQEGLCVHVPCSFSYPWRSWPTRERPYVYWFRSGDRFYTSQPVATNDPKKPVKTETRGRFDLVGKPSENNCSLRIREARRSDQGLYEFQVGKDYGTYTYRDKQLDLQVTGTAGPQESSGTRSPLSAQEQDTGTLPAPGLGAGMGGRDMGARGQLVP